ncbi:solute carrier family 2, facilitated glucose transporter member 11 [Loxodonta africana]|uniref:solute carrier family 2, facilitated glucose transporter member 11 n=1 Tax=Loxodonta africana TaxID=9785 RepID=UPI0030CB6793
MEDGGMSWAGTMCLVIERVSWQVLLMGGYCLMTCRGSVFTAARCLQVAGRHGGVAGGLVSASPPPLLQSSFPWMPYLPMSCIFTFILSFGIGPTGVTEVLATELFDQTTQPAAYVVYGVLLWTMLFSVGLGFPFIMEGWSHFVYVPFLLVCVYGAIYVGLFLPEAKGKTFLEISEELHRPNFPGPTQGSR